MIGVKLVDLQEKIERGERPDWAMGLVLENLDHFMDKDKTIAIIPREVWNRITGEDVPLSELSSDGSHAVYSIKLLQQRAKDWDMDEEDVEEWLSHAKSINEESYTMDKGVFNELYLEHKPKTEQTNRSPCKGCQGGL